MQILQAILNTLKSGESASLLELSAQLQISPDALLSAMEQLEHMGRIRRVRPAPSGCPHSCAGCHGCQTASGSVQDQGIRWELV